jgi:hypothetical protein
MRLERRNLFVTLRMLAAAGIVFDESAARRAPARGYFEGAHLVAAANWLAACVVHHYPKSELAKVWSVILGAGATLPR